MLYHVAFFYKNDFIRGKGHSPEECLRQVEQRLTESGYGGCKATFRPSDGTVYVNFGHIPCGIIYREGYS